MRDDARFCLLSITTYQFSVVQKGTIDFLTEKLTIFMSYGTLEVKFFLRNGY